MNLGKSKKTMQKTSKNRTMKRMGGAGTPTAKSVAKETQNLQSFLTKSAASTMGCTPGKLSSVLPKAITAAKKAIKYANEHHENPYARSMAEIKIQIADHWTKECGKRRNWRKEKNLVPNHEARDWYEPGQTIIWRLKDVNESARRRMREQVFPDLKEQMAMLQVDEEDPYKGTMYRAAKRRFERRIQGLDSASPSSK